MGRGTLLNCPCNGTKMSISALFCIIRMTAYKSWHDHLQSMTWSPWNGHDHLQSWHDHWFLSHPFYVFVIFVINTIKYNSMLSFSWIQVISGFTISAMQNFSFFLLFFAWLPKFRPNCWPLNYFNFLFRPLFMNSENYISSFVGNALSSVFSLLFFCYRLNSCLIQLLGCSSESKD